MIIFFGSIQSSRAFIYMLLDISFLCSKLLFTRSVKCLHIVGGSYHLRLKNSLIGIFLYDIIDVINVLLGRCRYQLVYCMNSQRQVMSWKKCCPFSNLCFWYFLSEKLIFVLLFTYSRDIMAERLDCKSLNN